MLFNMSEYFQLYTQIKAAAVNADDCYTEIFDIIDNIIQKIETHNEAERELAQLLGLSASSVCSDSSVNTLLQLKEQLTEEKKLCDRIVSYIFSLLTEQFPRPEHEPEKAFSFCESTYGAALEGLKSIEETMNDYFDNPSYISAGSDILHEKAAAFISELQSFCSFYDKFTRLLKEALIIRESCPPSSNYSISESQNNLPAPELSKVNFSAIAPKTMVKGEYSLIEIIIYEDDFRNEVEQIIADSEQISKEIKGSVLSLETGANIKIVLNSPDLAIDDDTEEQRWYGEYSRFTFPIMLPDDYRKTQILFTASVYINDVIATRLKFIVKCKSMREQKIEIERNDVLSAFVSYASQDRNRVAAIIMGMKKARPDMDIFFDVESLRSGDDWEKTLWAEIDKRDILFLCWSRFAKESKWVDAEWRYAFSSKGSDCIEPVPIESPDTCPPPGELTHKHFNDKLLYIINSGNGK